MEASEQLRRDHDILEGNILGQMIDGASKQTLLNCLREIYEVAYTAVPKSKHH